MLHLSTLKSKSFWIGIAQTVIGAGLVYYGAPQIGGTLLATGLSTIGLADRASKVLVALEKLHNALPAQ